MCLARAVPLLLRTAYLLRVYMLLKIIDSINEFVGRAVSLIAIVFAGIIIFDVIMRYFWHDPTRWAFDVTKQMYGFYFILLGGYALKHKAHVRVDLLIERCSPAVQKVLDLLGYLVFFFPFAWVFMVRTHAFAMRSWSQGEVTYGSVQLPVYPLKMAMFVASILLLMQGISEFLKILLNRDKGHSNGS